jgi:hypothetical protein
VELPAVELDDELVLVVEGVDAVAGDVCVGLGFGEAEVADEPCEGVLEA